jgi:hypothetical protein
MTTAQMPEGLPSLVNTYEGEVQCPVRFGFRPGNTR